MPLAFAMFATSSPSSPTPAPWLPLRLVQAASRAAAVQGVSAVARGPGGFVSAYTRAGGAARVLAAQPVAGGGGQTWAAKRAGFVARHEAQRRAQGASLWEPSGAPTRRALALAVWAWHPEPARLRRWLSAAGHFR